MTGLCVLSLETTQLNMEINLFITSFHFIIKHISLDYIFIHQNVHCNTRLFFVTTILMWTASQTIHCFHLACSSIKTCTSWPQRLFGTSATVSFTGFVGFFFYRAQSKFLLGTARLRSDVAIELTRMDVLSFQNTCPVNPGRALSLPVWCSSTYTFFLSQ